MTGVCRNKQLTIATGSNLISTYTHKIAILQSITVSEG